MVSPGRRSLIRNKLKAKLSESLDATGVKISKEDFISFFKKNNKNSTLLNMQGLRDCVMPVIMSNGSFHMYQAAGIALTNKRSPKRVRFSQTSLHKKNFREQWYENTDATSSLILGGMRLTSSMQHDEVAPL